MSQIQIKDATGAVVTAAKVDNTGQTSRSSSLPVVLASEDIAILNSIDSKTPTLINGLTPVEGLGFPSVARQVVASNTNTNTILTTTCRRISIRCRIADARFSIGTSAQVASSTNSHFIGADERLDFAISTNSQIACIRDAAANQDAIIEITELT